MITPFCDLPDPSQCSFESWANRLRDLLCTFGYTWDNLRVVGCETEIDEFSSLFSSELARINAVVIRHCEPEDPEAYFWNGVSWEHLVVSDRDAETYGSLITVVHADTNAVGYPYGFGVGALVKYTNVITNHATYGNYDSGTGIWTAAALGGIGMYRITASYTLRLNVSNLGRVGGNPAIYNVIQLWRSSTIFDLRTLLDNQMPAFVRWQDNGPIPDTSPQTFDIKLPQAALPSAGNIQWLNVNLRVSGVNWIKGGNTVVVRVGSGIQDMTGTAFWGVGGGSVPSKQEILTIERMHTNIP